MPTSDATLRSQARTLEDAHHSGLEWTHADIAALESHEGRDEDLALALGRTLFAIYAMREALANGRGAREGRDVARTRSRVLPYDLGFTTIPDDDAWL